MARRRKRATTTPARRRTTRRTGALGSSKGLDIMAVVYAASGGIGAKLVDKILPANLDPKLASGGKLVLGAMLPMLARDAKTKEMLRSIGLGIVTVGATELLQEFGIVNAPETDFDIAVALDDEMNGNDLSVMNDDILNDRVLNDLSVMNAASYDARMLLD